MPPCSGPRPRNFVRSLRCSFDVLMWGQKQTLRLLAPWLAPLTSSPRRVRDGSVGSAVEPTVDYAQEVAAVSAEIEADIQADIQAEMEAAIDAGLVPMSTRSRRNWTLQSMPRWPLRPSRRPICVRPDDLTVIDGIGPKLAERLNAVGRLDVRRPRCLAAGRHRTLRGDPPARAARPARARGLDRPGERPGLSRRLSDPAGGAPGPIAVPRTGTVGDRWQTGAAGFWTSTA